MRSVCKADGIVSPNQPKGDRLRKQLTRRICKTHPPVVEEALQAVRINRGQQNNQTHQAEEAVAEQTERPDGLVRRSKTPAIDLEPTPQCRNHTCKKNRQ